MPRPRPALSSGVLLVGGRSSRFGQPKALLELRGEPMLARVARAVVPACDELVVVAAPRSAVSPDLLAGLHRVVRSLARRWAALGGLDRSGAPRPRVRLVHDARAHLGPVAGLAAGLGAARGEVAFVTACDLPLLEPALVRRLLAAAREGDGFDVVVPRWRGFLEPLVAAYRVAPMAAHYARQLERRQLRPTRDLDALRVRVLEEQDVLAVDGAGRSFVNLNAREDVETVRALLGGSGAGGADAGGGRSPTARGSRPGRSPRGSSAGG